MSKPEAENSPNPPSGSDFYQILDQLMLAAESNNLQAENEIFNQISDWHSSDIQKFTQLTNQVLNDLDSNYNLIKSKFDQSKLEILEKNGIGAGKSGYNTEKINNGQKENSTNFSDYEFCLEQLKAENLQLEKEEKELILKLENLQKSVSRKQKELIEYEKNIAKNDIMEDQLTNDYFDYWEEVEFGTYA